ncbi:hypothetical protein KKH39_01560 [Patescibacteria group bacterium]|nr:hypothetical protein [Patescibacteria group bacterium]
METFWNMFLGVLAGVIAGSIINILLDVIKNKVSEKNRKKNFRFEIDYNITHVEKILEEFKVYRNHVNGDILFRYFGYYQLSKILNYSIDSMLQDGSVYKFLKHENITKLKNFFSDFSLTAENYLNNQVKWNKENIMKDGIKQEPIKQLALSNIDFWENKYEEHKKALGDIKENIKL